MSLQYWFIQKHKYKRETSLWQSNFLISSISANLDTQSPRYVSNSCFILPCVFQIGNAKKLMQKSQFRGRILFFYKNLLSLQKYRKTFKKREWMDLQDEKNFAFTRTSHFAQPNSSVDDVFSFFIYAFFMQIHLFPFWWYVWKWFLVDITMPFYTIF